jgi:hypothetical protein
MKQHWPRTAPKLGGTRRARPRLSASAHLLKTGGTAPDVDFNILGSLGIVSSLLAEQPLSSIYALDETQLILIGSFGRFNLGFIGSVPLGADVPLHWQSPGLGDENLGTYVKWFVPRQGDGLLVISVRIPSWLRV